MHPRMLQAIIDNCQQRIQEGDCPTVGPFSTQQLESAIVQLHHELVQLKSSVSSTSAIDNYEQQSGTC